MADFAGKVFIDGLLIDIQGNQVFCVFGFFYLFMKYQREIRSRSPNKKISQSQYFTHFLVSSALQEDQKLPHFPNSVTGCPRLQWKLEIHKILNSYHNWSSSSFIYMALSTFKTFFYCRFYYILQLCHEEEKNEKTFYSFPSFPHQHHVCVNIYQALVCVLSASNFICH